MKTLFLTLMASAALATSAMAAPTATVTGGYTFNKVGGDSQFVAADVASQLPASPFSVDLFMQDNVPVNTPVRSGSTQHIEVGLSVPVIGPTYVRAAVGDAAHDYSFHYILNGNKLVLNPTATDHQYYNLTAGINLTVTKDVILDASEKYENTFTNTNQFETWTTSVGASYAFNNNLALRVGYARTEGNTRSDTVEAGAKVTF